MQRLFALMVMLTASTALAQSPPQLPAPQPAQQQRPTADQINIQLLEREAASYRQTIGQLVVDANALTDRINALTKERDELLVKCGSACTPKK
jgi:biopolymer transport protein ExbD